MERSQFNSRLLHLRKIVLDGISYFIVWQAFNREYEDSTVDYIQHRGVWWQYSGFLAPVRNALLWSTLMQLSKAFDTDTRTTSLSNLLVNARNNPAELAPYATNESLGDIQVKIGNNLKLLQKLRDFRNKRLVHYDSTEMENIEISSGEVNTLVEETKSIFNSLKYACEGESDNFDDIMKNVGIHTSEVISMMKGEELS